jgi:phytoene dehydrogenase-like protein
MHAIVVNHFITGGYYPKGGPEEIAKSIIPNIEKYGGRCLIKHNVNKIIIKNGKAIGVRAENRTKSITKISDYFAPVIVSNAGVFNTYTKLIPKNIHIPFRKKITGMNGISKCVALYVGLKDNIRTLGIKAANHWIYSTYNHDKNYLNKNILEGKPSSCYLSTMTNRDENRPVNTAIIIAYVDFKEFKQWQHQKSGKRDKEYYILKKKISKGLINFVNERYPGFNKLIDYAELATPLTSEHFTDHPEGAMYGFPATPERYKYNWIKVSTPVTGLYMTGADVSGLGVVCSMLGGFATACFLNGSFGLFKLMAKVRRYNRTEA